MLPQLPAGTEALSRPVAPRHTLQAGIRGWGPLWPIPPPPRKEKEALGGKEVVGSSRHERPRTTALRLVAWASLLELMFWQNGFLLAQFPGHQVTGSLSEKLKPASGTDALPHLTFSRGLCLMGPCCPFFAQTQTTHFLKTATVLGVITCSKLVKGSRRMANVRVWRSSPLAKGRRKALGGMPGPSVGRCYFFKLGRGHSRVHNYSLNCSDAFYVLFSMYTFHEVSGVFYHKNHFSEAPLPRLPPWPFSEASTLGCTGSTPHSATTTCYPAFPSLPATACPGFGSLGPLSDSNTVDTPLSSAPATTWELYKRMCCTESCFPDRNLPPS